MKLDRRVARTRRALGVALVDLSMEKGYEKISIKDLTHRADIGYATFFRHYKSKDELLIDFLGAIMQEIGNAIKPETSPYEQSLASFNVLAKHKEAVLIGLDLPRDHRAMQPLWKQVFDIVHNLYEARDEEVIPLEVSVNHIVRSVSELLRWWITEGQDYSPEQMARMQSDLIISVAEQVSVVPRQVDRKENPSA